MLRNMQQLHPQNMFSYYLGRYWNGCTRVGCCWSSCKHDESAVRLDVKKEVVDEPRREKRSRWDDPDDRDERDDRDGRKPRDHAPYIRRRRDLSISSQSQFRILSGKTTATGVTEGKTNQGRVIVNGAIAILVMT